MSQHIVNLSWNRESDDFSLATYNRSHLWDFGHSNTVKASAAANYCGDADRVDPEQAFTASIASCHMLTFLAVASQKGYTVDQYQDDAKGVLSKNEQGVMAVCDVYLAPNVSFSGDIVPSLDDIKALHDCAHKQCFIANSVNTRIHVEID